MTSHAAAPDLAGLLPHLSDLAAEMSDLMPAFMRGASAHHQAVAALNERYRTRIGRQWQEITAGTHATPSSLSDIPYFAWLNALHRLQSEWALELISLLDLEDKDRTRLQFFLQQWIAATAPANFPAGNPLVLKRALDTAGDSLMQGARNLQRDTARGRLRMTDESAFEVGRNLAVTAGAVVYENPLIQIIQYKPTTARVYSLPLLIIPPFINKYYVLDLRSENSFVRHALDQGFQVFMISWRNIGPDLAMLTWDDYARLGVETAVSVVLDIARTKSLHALGFCVGGTLLASTLGSIVQPERVSSLTLLAALLDFSKVGDISAYLDARFMARTEARFAQGGIVPGAQLAGAFASLRPRDLIWKFYIENYLLGETPAAFDLLHWNSDSANLPGPLFVWYLRQLYFENRLRSPGALRIYGQTVDLSRLNMPILALGAELDHIVPWQGAYENVRLLGDRCEFVLASSGHIAGVISPVAGSRRHFRTSGSRAADATQWLSTSEQHRGSWWPYWTDWLAAIQSRQKKAPVTLGNKRHAIVEAAPGRYVRD